MWRRWHVYRARRCRAQRPVLPVVRPAAQAGTQPPQEALRRRLGHVVRLPHIIRLLVRRRLADLRYGAACQLYPGSGRRGCRRHGTPRTRNKTLSQRMAASAGARSLGRPALQERVWSASSALTAAQPLPQLPAPARLLRPPPIRVSRRSRDGSSLATTRWQTKESAAPAESRALVGCPAVVTREGRTARTHER